MFDAIWDEPVTSALTRPMLMCAGSMAEFRVQVMVKFWGVRIVPEVGDVIWRAATRGARRRKGAKRGEG